MSQLNPDDFVISRKRKKYKFAKFHNSPLCFEHEDWLQLQAGVLQQVHTVEVGAGNGLFSVELAARNPKKQFVAMDVKADRLQKGAYEAAARGLSNVRFIRSRADQLGELFPAQSIQTIWLTFPDPYPKKRSAGRRLTHATFLATYRSLLAPTLQGRTLQAGRLHLKHDNTEFFQWSLEELVTTKWHISELSFDLHASTLSDEYKIVTTYEARWLSEGATICCVTGRPL